jgi:hypothetical protein
VSIYSSSIRVLRSLSNCFVCYPFSLKKRPRSFLLILLVVAAIDKHKTAMSTTRIPLHRVQGTHYQCAYSVGCQTRQAIQKRIEDDFACLSRLFAFASTEYGRQFHQNFIDIIRGRYPWYWDEIRGLADGCELPLEQILVLNFINETQTEHDRCEEKQRTSSNIDRTSIDEIGERGCTTVLINRRDTNTFSLLHNEDHAQALFVTGYLVEADIQSSAYDNGQRHSPQEKFLAFCYAGGIPGKFDMIINNRRKFSPSRISQCIGISSSFQMMTSQFIHIS